MYISMYRTEIPTIIDPVALGYFSVALGSIIIVRMSVDHMTALCTCCGRFELVCMYVCMHICMYALCTCCGRFEVDSWIFLSAVEACRWASVFFHHISKCTYIQTNSRPHQQIHIHNKFTSISTIWLHIKKITSYH